MTHRFTRAALFAVFLACSGLACGGDPQQASLARIRAWRPADFFTDAATARLAEAVAEGDQAVIDALVRDGADVNAKGKDGIPLLVWAIAKDSVAGFDALIRHGADLTAFVRDPALAKNNEATDRVIQLAVSSSDPKFLRAAIDSGFDPDFVSDEETKESLLFDAVKHHSEAAVRLLLDANANVNHVNATGSTAVRFANNVSYYKMVAYLLERGVDPTIPDKWDKDLVADLKDRGDNGIPVDQKKSFKQVVAELERRGLLTQQDIIDATARRKDRKRTQRGSTIIHPRDSATGRNIDAMDKSTPEAGAP
jgi:ankyrin repeat protein